MSVEIDALIENIKRLCEKQGISVNELAKRSGLTQSTIDSILKGKSKNPKFSTLRKISQGFNMDYDEFILELRSIEDEFTPLKGITENSDFATRLSRRLRKIRKDNDVLLVDIVKATGVRSDYESDGFFHNYYSFLSPVETLIALADYFDVSLDYLVGRSDDPKRY